MKTIIRSKNTDFNSLPSIFDEFFNDWSQGSVLKSYHAPANVLETDTEFLLELVTPGHKKSDFNVLLDNNLLTISLEQSHAEPQNKQRYIRREHDSRDFKRSFRLPENMIETNGIEANYEAGILYVRLPKREAIKPQSSVVVEVK